MIINGYMGEGSSAFEFIIRNILYRLRGKMEISLRRKILGGLIVMFVVAMLAGTIPLSAQPHSGDQASLGRAMKTPLVFTVPRAQSEKVWNRITSFMTKYLKGGTQGEISDSVAATAPLHVGILKRQEVGASVYRASQTATGDVAMFSIQSDLLSRNEKLAEQQTFIWTNADLKIVDRNLHLWALYARTGELQPELVDQSH
jgi:hypothetical protein